MSHRFLSEFFGRTRVNKEESGFSVIPGDHITAISQPNSQSLPREELQMLGRSLRKKSTSPDPAPFANSIGATKTTVEDCKDQLHANHDLAYRLEQAFMTDEGKAQTRPLSEFAENIGLADPSDPKHDAARGLLSALDVPDRNLPRIRIHHFTKNLEGLWASCVPDVSNAPGNRPFSTLQESPESVSDEDGRRLLELLYCESCGTSLFAGRRICVTSSEDDGFGTLVDDKLVGFEMSAIEPNLEGSPLGVNSELTEFLPHSELVVFWPGQDLQDGADEIWYAAPRHELDQKAYREVGQESMKNCRWVPATLNCSTGQIRLQQAAAEPDDRHGHVFSVVGNSGLVPETSKAFLSDAEELRGLPSICPCCGRDFSRRRRSSPIRNFRPGIEQATQVVARGLAAGLDGPKSETPKLVCFSDSRDQAAGLASQVEIRHYDDRFRRVVADLLATWNDRELRRVNFLSQLGAKTARDLREEIRRNSDLPDEWEGQVTRLDDLLAEEREKKKTIPESQKLLKPTSFPFYSLLSDIHPTSRSVQDFVRLCLQSGHCPFGFTVLAGKDQHDWTALFTAANGHWEWSQRACQADSREHELRIQLLNSLLPVLGSLAFSRSYFGFEQMGLAVLTLDPITDQLSSLLKQESNSHAIDESDIRAGIEQVIAWLAENYRQDSRGRFGPTAWTAKDVVDKATRTTAGEPKTQLRKLVNGLAKCWRVSPDITADILERLLGAAGHSGFIARLKDIRLRPIKSDSIPSC
ncbi:hypothetical protein MK280_11180, partial [Myxococcota bacterium]|nr:hypothetical protein [Myxococcota bacterium]